MPSEFTQLPVGAQIMLIALLLFAGYVIWSLFSLLWRVPDLVLAKTKLAEAQTRYYKLAADRIEPGR